MDVGSTFLDLLRTYGTEIHSGEGRLLLAGVGPQLMEQLERTGTADLIGRENIFPATPVVTESLEDAVVEGKRWLAEEPDMS